MHTHTRAQTVPKTFSLLWKWKCTVFTTKFHGETFWSRSYMKFWVLQCFWFFSLLYTHFMSVGSAPIAFIHSFIYSRYFYSTSSSPLLLRGAPDYSINIVSELTCWRTTGNCEWWTCPSSLRGGYSGIRTCDPLDAMHRTYHWATMPHVYMLLAMVISNFLGWANVL